MATAFFFLSLLQFRASLLDRLDAWCSFALEHNIYPPRRNFQPPSAISHALSVVVDVRLRELASVGLVVQISISNILNMCWS